VYPENEWIKQKKTKRTNKDLLSINNEQNVYINENLTQQMRKLRWNAKSTLRTIYKYIWVQDHRLLARRNDTSGIQRIKSDADIGKLLSAAQSAQ
jgi:hypothetical protein